MALGAVVGLDVAVLEGVKLGVKVTVEVVVSVGVLVAVSVGEVHQAHGNKN